jgi:hypothetical protein
VGVVEVNRSKQKGTAAETAIVGYLRTNGFPYAERRALAGNTDKGDVAGIPGVVIEAKACAKMELASWVDEATVEGRNAKATIAAVWHKRRGKGSPADWYVTVTGETFLHLIAETDRAA